MKIQTALGLLFASQLATAHAAGPAARPNILFIYTDDQSYRTVSCYEGAYPGIHTPNIDALAANGVRFRSAYIGTWCMPSRAAMLTGRQQYGVQSMTMTGKYPASGYDPQQCPFWPAELRKSGYQTAQIGKWHTGTDTGFGRDWDYQAVWNRPKYPDNAPNYYYDQLISVNGAEPTMVKGYSTDNYTNWAVDYIKGQNRSVDKPWYLWVCYGGSHSPYTPAARHKQSYSDSPIDIPKDIYPPRAGKPAYMQEMAAWKPGPDGQPVLNQAKDAKQLGDEAVPNLGQTLPEWVRQYNQTVASLDEGVGKIMAALRESGQLDNTLVIFTSDQGFSWGYHGFRHKVGPYDDTIRSPLIISMPGRVAENQVCKTPVSGVDLVATILSFADLKVPWDIHGYSFASLLKDPSAPWPHDAMLAMTARQYGSDTDVIPSPDKIRLNGVPWYVLLRRDQYKYIRTLVAGEVEELYDLDKDPDELTNLATDPKYAATLRQLRDSTVSELTRTHAGFVKNLPSVREEAAATATQ